MVQFTQMKGGGGVVSQVAIGRPVKGQPVKLVIQLPIGVWLPTGIKLMGGAKDPGLLTTFKRCTAAACFADAEIKADMIRKFRTATEAGQIQFKDGNQKDGIAAGVVQGFRHGVRRAAERIAAGYRGTNSTGTVSVMVGCVMPGKNAGIGCARCSIASTSWSSAGTPELRTMLLRQHPAVAVDAEAQHHRARRRPSALLG